jgi:zinc protease
MSISSAPFLRLPALLLALLPAGVLAVNPPTSDLPVDPAIHFGTLENGLRYAILPHAMPQGRASIRLLVGAGSLDETEEEQGLAHFLEHMAFNGTERFPSNTLIKWFQRQGMSFGGDSNAMTGLETTTYLLELSDTSATLLGEGLAILRDFADGMLIEEAEVDQERGVILAEKRARDSIEYRGSVAQFAFLLSDTRPPRRLPIGLEETIQAANAARLRGFFERWYRPDNTILVVVGEVEPEAVGALITEHFRSMRNDGEPPPRAPLGTIVPHEAPVAGLHRESEASSVTVTLSVVTAWETPPDSRAARLDELPLQAAHGMLNRRLSILARQEQAPFTQGSARSSELFDFARVTSLGLTGPADRWADSLALAEQEVRRAVQEGFTAAELAEFQATQSKLLEDAARGAPTRRSPQIAGALVNALYQERVFTTPRFDFELLQPAIAALTPEACRAALEEAWTACAPRFFVSGQVPAEVTPAEILATYEASRQLPVEAAAATVLEDFAYTDFGPSGHIVNRTHVADLDLWLVEFANGVRLNLKRTDFQAHRVDLLARLGGGQQQVPLDRPELALLARRLLFEGGLGQHSREALRSLLAGRTANLDFRVAEDAFIFEGNTTPDDLALTLQLLAARLSDAGWRRDGLETTRQSFIQSYERLDHVLGGITQDKVPFLLADGDPRFGLPPLPAVLRAEPADLAAWLDPIFRQAPLELALVGDFDPEEAIAAVAATLGALPPRPTTQTAGMGPPVRFPAVPPRETFQLETTLPQALTLVVWPTTDSSDVQKVRRLRLLSSIMRDRLRLVVREELAASYAPRASSSNSDAYPGYGLFTVSVEVAPEATASILEAILAIAEDLRTKGVTPDELERAREPTLTAVRQSLRENSYWLRSVLARAQSEPEYLDHARHREADLEAITVEELSALATTYLREERAARFQVQPVAPAPGEG